MDSLTKMRLVWLAAALILLAACAPGIAPEHPTVEPPGDTQIPVADLQADFDTLWSTLQRAHFDLFARRSQAEFQRQFEQTRAALTTPMTRLQAQLRFQRFVAYGRVAHARIDLPIERWASFREGGGKALPLTLRVDGDRVFVLQDLSGAPDIAAGDEVLAVGGEPVLAWLQRIGGLVSADTDYLSYAQMQGMLPALVWFGLGEIDGVTLSLASASGGQRDAWLPARTRAQVIATEAAEADGDKAIDMQSRDLRLLDPGIAYLRPGPFYDNRPDAESPWDRSAFRSFVDQSFAQLMAAGSSDLLIDLRDNPGGDNSFSDLLVAWFASKPFRFSEAFEIRVSAETIASNQARLDSAPVDAGGASAEMAALFAGQALGSVVRYPIAQVAPRDGARFRGRVFVLVNRQSYSNAVSVAAIVQDYGFGLVMGEETADLATTLGAMEQFRLPRTGLTVGYPKARILRPSGNPDARGVVPDLPLPRPVLEGAEDPVLQAALATIRRQRI